MACGDITAFDDPAFSAQTHNRILARIAGLDRPCSPRCTAGNASRLSAGVSACMVMETCLASRSGLRLLGIYRDKAVAACEPVKTDIDPVTGIPKL